MKRLPRSIRKYIRKEKARIRREFLTAIGREEAINKLLSSIKSPSIRVEGDKSQSTDLKKSKPAKEKPLTKKITFQEE